ncbi:MAG TPA: dienelactone hydrolase family protein [Puia sp.]|jgi:carboxymethylenebutenolidase|nr:dienelactone hydrolase family protein [Puia sp.]
MVNHEFNTVAVSDGTEMDLYVATPNGEKVPFPLVIVLQEAFGVNGHIRRIADRLSYEGYAAVAPDLFHRTGRRLELPYSDFSKVAPHFQALTTEGMTADLQAVHQWAQQQPNIRTDKMGSVGFCLGGRVSFLANAVLPLSAAVSYYGGYLDKLVDLAPQLHAHHLFFWGGKDQHIPKETIDKVTGAVQAAGKTYTNVVISDADHAFSCDERPAYHPTAAKEAWAHTLTFFSNRLKG